MPAISDLVRILINKISNRVSPGPIFGSRIFLIARLGVGKHLSLLLD